VQTVIKTLGSSFSEHGKESCIFEKQRHDGSLSLLLIISLLLAHSMSLCNHEASVVRLSVCLSICLSVNFVQIATSTTEVAGSLPNLHTMVPRRACIQGAQGQGQGQRSRDTDTFLPTRKSLLLPQI